MSEKTETTRERQLARRVLRDISTHGCITEGTLQALRHAAGYKPAPGLGPKGGRSMDLLKVVLEAAGGKRS